VIEQDMDEVFTSPLMRVRRGGNCARSAGRELRQRLRVGEAGRLIGQEGPALVALGIAGGRQSTCSKAIVMNLSFNSGVGSVPASPDSDLARFRACASDSGLFAIASACCGTTLSLRR